MKKIIITICCLWGFCTLQPSFAQNYLHYYKLAHQAEAFIWQKDYLTALTKYKEAFPSVDYILFKELNNSLICAAIVGDTNFLFEFLPIFMEHGLIIDKLATIEPFIRWTEHPQWKQLVSQKDYYKDIYLHSINKEYLHIIDSLNCMDQDIRHKIHNDCFLPHKHVTKRISRELEMLCKVDSAVQKGVMENIQKYGYINERISGGKYAQRPPVCYHHYIDSSFVALEYEMVVKGYLSPEAYAHKLFYIRYDTMLNYRYAETPEMVERIDYRRSLLGLPSYSDLLIFYTREYLKSGYPFIFYTCTLLRKKKK